MNELLCLRGLTIRFNNGAPPVLSDIQLSVGADECHCIVGPTGSGKSSLLRACAGLLPPENLKGDIARPPRFGVVLQNPGTQILCDHVGTEAAFALENAGVSPELMPDRVRQALAEADLDIPTHSPTAHLSMGRQYRLVLAGALVNAPSLLLLDEPCAQLDPSGCSTVAKVIDSIRKQGGGVLLCEHEPQALADRVTHWWRIRDGRLSPVDSAQGVLADAEAKPQPWNVPTPDGPQLLRLEDLSLSLGGNQLFSGLDLTMHPGEAVHLEGKNGCGKSTLIRLITGFLAPDSGSVALFGAPAAPARLRGRVGLVLQSPVGQLFEDTTERELAYAARKKGLPHSAARISSIAEILGITPLLGEAPHRLSYGQQRLVALGACLVQEPELLILDDPFAGLDMEARQRVRRLLDKERAQRNMAVLVTGHNPRSALRFPHFYSSELRFEGGRLARVA